MIDIIDAIDDPHLFGPWFAGPSWRPWKAVLKAACGHPLDDDELVIFRQVAHRDPPRRRVRELWIVAGRRAGKDSIASALAAHAAGFRDYGAVLRPGELASILCLAVDKDQAKIVARYTKAFFERIPMLADLVLRETTSGMDLSTQAELAVITSNFRSVRGRSVALAILDECAFWRDEASASPDTETYTALLPGLVTIPGAMLCAMSSPYRKGGLLYQKWRDHFGKSSDDVLVIQSASKTLNPTLPQQTVDEAMEADPAAARSEWLGEWRDDVEAFLPREVVEAAIDQGVIARPRLPNMRYVGFADAASGTGGDSFAIGIAHLERDTVIVDVAHEIKPPFNPQSAIAEVSRIFSEYGIKQIVGDRWAPGFTADGFQTNGVRYKYSERDRSQIYLEALPSLVSGRVRLPENRRLVNQMSGLERKTASSGRDRIDHPSGSNYHDDLANAVCGAVVEAVSGPAPMRISEEALRRAGAVGYGAPRPPSPEMLRRAGVFIC